MEYTWRVVKDCRFVGYVVAFSEIEALSRAEKQYGKRIWIERVYSPAGKTYELQKSSQICSGDVSSY
jgi:hypothetical protein